MLLKKIKIYDKIYLQLYWLRILLLEQVTQKPRTREKLLRDWL